MLVSAEYVTTATVDYINRLGVGMRAGQPAEPFSISVGLMLPHQPFVANMKPRNLIRVDFHEAMTKLAYVLRLKHHVEDVIFSSLNVHLNQRYVTVFV